MRQIIDLANLYLSMFIHYVLILPYALRVIVGVAVLFLLVRFALFCIKRLIVPFIFWILRQAILGLQLMAYGLVKMFPSFAQTGAGMDEALNGIGMKLDSRKDQDPEGTADHGKKNKLLSRAFWAVLAASLLFIVVPYYLEPILSGSAKEICEKVNRGSESFQAGMLKYVDKYYQVEDDGQKKAEADVDEKKEDAVEKHVLHLNKNGYQGANLRKSPKMKKNNIITAISGDIELIYENKYVDDGKRVWLKVSTKDVSKAWISEKLIKKKDLKAAGIE